MNDQGQSVRDMHESFRHYRNTAVAWSITIIGVSGALFTQIELLGPPSLSRSVLIIVLGLVVIAACFLQYCHTIGHMFLARWLYYSVHHQKDDAADSKTKSDRWFGRLMDKFIHGLMILFFVQIVLFAALLLGFRI